MMKNIPFFSVLVLFTALIILSTVDFFLLEDNFLHSSISSIIDNSHQLDVTTHVLVLGLLPIYIATVIFGAGLFGIGLGIFLHKMIRNKFRAKKVSSMKNHT